MRTLLVATALASFLASCSKDSIQTVEGFFAGNEISCSTSCDTTIRAIEISSAGGGQITVDNVTFEKTCHKTGYWKFERQNLGGKQVLEYYKDGDNVVLSTYAEEAEVASIVFTGQRVLQE